MSEQHELGASRAHQQHQDINEDNNNNSNDHMTEEDDKNHLGRRMSAPARFKSVLGQDKNQSDPNEDQFECKKYDRLRHSMGDRRAASREAAGQHNGLASHHQHKSVSPLSGSSSSASDSAFSRSRSTLGSTDGDQSTNCFTNSSLKGSQSQLSEARKADKTNNRHHKHHRHSNSDLPSTYGQDDDHFRIIWRDLTYRVPQKRLDRLTGGLRARFWSKTKPSAGKAEVGEKNNNDNSNLQITVDQSRGCSPSDCGGPPADDVQQTNPRVPVPASKQRQVIFSSLNGCVKSGQLTAILGPSGAGKTTFLKCLTSSIERGVSGSIDITGGSATSQQLKLCIIPQKGEYFLLFCVFV